MDLKSKGISWVGNIYQRFETMCQEVDNIVNQDAVKYVENQVQTVGENMKKFCSDVVQIVDPVRCEAQAVALKGNAAVGTYVKSIIGTEEDHGHAAPIRQSYLEPSDLDTMNGFDGLNLVNQSTVPASGEPHEGVESDSAGNIDDIATDENSDLSTGENATNENCSPPEAEALDLTASLLNESVSVSLSHELTDSNNENACFSSDEGAPSTSADGREFQPSQKVGINCYSHFDDSDSLSDVPSTVALSEMAFSVASSCGSIFTEPRTLPGNSFNDVLAKIESNDNPVNEAASDSDSSSFLFPSTSTPIVCSNKEETETGFSCTNSVLSLESTDRSVSVMSSASIPFVSSDKDETETRYFCSNSVLSLESTDRSISLVSSASIPIVSSDKEEVETGLSCFNCVISLESTGCASCAARTIDDTADSGMETVDLSDKLKLEESCVIVDNSMLYDVSRRIHRLRSYKKKIQDAFNSKKRVSKEYEQLAIWFGDLDIESSQDAPTGTTINLDPDFRIQHPQDSEWELL